MAAPAALRRRETAAIVVVLLALALTAWLITDVRMAGMDAGPWTDPGSFGFYVSAWVVMMAAMMFPSVSPTVALYARMTSAQSDGRPLLFALGSPLVRFVYGERWGAASGPLRWLAVLGAMRVVAELGYDYLVAAGHPRATVILQASGTSGVTVEPESEDELRLGEAIDSVMRQLAMLVVRDGEGARRAGRVVVHGGEERTAGEQLPSVDPGRTTTEVCRATLATFKKPRSDAFA